MQKRVFYTELSYLIGLIALALGTALMERANFGMSMVVAPAYVLHLKISRALPFYSFGMSEYVLQAALLLVMCLILGRFRKSYLFSFVTAVLYGFLLDGSMALTARLPGEGALWRCVFYAAGQAVCVAGVALLLRTYIAPEVYELFVRELSDKYGWPIGKVKTVYDCCSCLAAVALSFLFFGFGHFEGVKLGTVLCALINGPMIGAALTLVDRVFEFRDALPLRGLFAQ